MFVLYGQLPNSVVSSVSFEASSIQQLTRGLTSRSKTYLSKHRNKYVFVACFNVVGKLLVVRDVNHVIESELGHIQIFF